MKIGMTGGIGSGKNKATEFFIKLGFFAIDADKLSRKVMSPDNEAYNKIVEAFGSGILDTEHQIDRKKLGDIIFQNHEKRQILEHIVHPAIFKEEARQRSAIKSKDDKALIITHAALMVESGSYKNYDVLIVVYAETETRIKRIVERDKISAVEARRIMAAQLPEEEKLAHAHIIIDNSLGEKELQAEVERAANLIKQMIYGQAHS